MASGVFAKECRQAAGVSVVDWCGARHIFAAAAPHDHVSFDRQADAALARIDAAMRRLDVAPSIVRQTVFLADADTIDRCRQIVADFYGGRLPATTYVLQPPCDGAMLAVEAQAIGSDSGQIDIRRESGQLVVAAHDGVTWFHSAEVGDAGSEIAAHNGVAANIAPSQGGWRT
jgi:hypothetical protein